MTKKLLVGLTTVLAIALTYVAPALAETDTLEFGACQAVKSGGGEAPCKAKEKFTAFTGPTEVTTKGADFEFESGFPGAWNCTKLKDEGTDENVGGVGHGREILEFSKCTAVFEGKTCKIANIVGEVTEQVISATEVRYTVLEPGIPLTFTGKPAGCPEGTIGDITGAIAGKVASGSNEVTFSHAGGLKLDGGELFITGYDEVVTKTGKKPVYIN